MPEQNPNVSDQVGEAGQAGAAETAVAGPKPGSVPAAPPKKGAKGSSADPRRLPHYTRSLLRIKVPVVVTLAENRQPLHRIVELGPGSIIQFDKSCEEMLELAVGNRTIASGEAVKVGDKFGLRITSIILPEERFLSVRPGQR
jgi:flagellar motor switch/type III secretory pathway protein FliN